tara:strand:+ start:1699 stop:1980 length:282 start_codon:yes stop_codon:yes gene_type:complete
MFGISFFEFLLIIIIFILAIDPRDLPNIIKKIIEGFFGFRDYFNQISQDIGFDDIKNEVENNLNNEKMKNITEITDIYGVKHNITDENIIKKS